MCGQTENYNSKISLKHDFLNPLSVLKCLIKSDSHQSQDEVPIATSEVVIPSGGGVGRPGASTTSSPSLEVQQILHSQNGKGY